MSPHTPTAPHRAAHQDLADIGDELVDAALAVLDPTATAFLPLLQHTLADLIAEARADIPRRCADLPRGRLTTPQIAVTDTVTAERWHQAWESARLAADPRDLLARVAALEGVLDLTPPPTEGALVATHTIPPAIEELLFRAQVLARHRENTTPCAQTAPSTT